MFYGGMVMNKYDAILICGLFVAALSVLLRFVCIITDVTLAEGFVVMWLSYRASGRLYRYDCKVEREFYCKQSK